MISIVQTALIKLPNANKILWPFNISRVKKFITSQYQVKANQISKAIAQCKHPYPLLPQKFTPV